MRERMTPARSLRVLLVAATLATGIAGVGQFAAAAKQQLPETTPEGLHFKEVWLYWDTALLLPHLPGEAVVFKTKNVLASE